MIKRIIRFSAENRYLVIAATIVATGPRMPAVSQVIAAPGAGMSGKMQRRHAEVWGSTVRDMPVVATAPP